MGRLHVRVDVVPPKLFEEFKIHFVMDVFI
jgi:hypothetical protein